MNEPVLVTGATGNVGSELVRLLRNSGVRVRAAVPNLTSAKERLGSGIDLAPFDFRRPDTFGRAFAGIRKLFLVRPPAISRTQRFINPAIDAAKRAGVEHIVFLSLLGAERNPMVPHRSIERHLETSGLAWTFLRPSFFMQNLSTTHREEIRQRGEIFVPAGEGRTSFIDTRDIAAVAAKVLTKGGYRNATYLLTGSEALDYHQVAEIFSEVLGWTIAYSDPSPLAFAQRMRARGHPWGFVAVMIGIYTVCRVGLADTVTDDAERLLDRAPNTLRRFVEDHRALWM